MQHFLGFSTLISISACAAANYYDVETGQMDMGNAEDAKWTIVRKPCWSDTLKGVRGLDHGAKDFDAKWTTPRECRAACEAEGYSLAAVEYGHQCWCGNTIAGDAEPVDDALCSEPCSGDDKQTCGGYGHMNLWALRNRDFLIAGNEFNLSSTWKPEACYKDIDANHRLLPFQPKHGVEPENQRTVQGCINACQGHGYGYAGLENGAECWCGSECPPERLKGGKCDMFCKGDGKQYCGGQQSLLVYSRDGYTKGDANARKTSPSDYFYKHNQVPVSVPVNALKSEVQISAAVPRQIPGTGIAGLPGLPGLPKLPIPLPGLPKLPVPLPGLPKLPKVPKLPVPLPELPDIGDIVKQIKPAVSNMFTTIQSDVSVGKKTASAILDHISLNPSGPELDVFLMELLKDVELDAGNPVGDAIAKVKAIITKMFDKIIKDITATKTAALLLLDHLPGHDLGED